MIKKLLITAATLFFVLGAYNIAKADDTCPRGSFAEILPELQKAQVENEVLSKEETAAIVEKKGGTPPGIEAGEDFKIVIIKHEGLAQVLFVNSKGCITHVTPQRPAPEETINNFLGRVPA